MISFWLTLDIATIRWIRGSRGGVWCLIPHGLLHFSWFPQKPILCSSPFPFCFEGSFPTQVLASNFPNLKTSSQISRCISFLLYASDATSSPTQLCCSSRFSWLRSLCLCQDSLSMAGKNANRTGFSRKSVKGDPKKSKTVAVARPSKRRKASVSPDTTGFKCRAKVGKKMCGRLFDSYSELKKHLKTIHPATRLYFCDHGCERVFTSLSSQTTHHLSDHTDKVVTCPNCVDTFSEVDEFIEHMKVAHPEHKSVIKVPLKFLQSKIPNFNIRSLGHKKAEAVGEDDVGDPVDEEEQDEDEEMRLVSSAHSSFLLL